MWTVTSAWPPVSLGKSVCASASSWADKEKGLEVTGLSRLAGQEGWHLPPLPVRERAQMVLGVGTLLGVLHLRSIPCPQHRGTGHRAPSVLPTTGHSSACSQALAQGP